MDTMRRLLLAAAAALALVFAGSASTAPSATVTVRILSTKFTPAGVTITAGDAVTWRNDDTKNHQVVANGGQFVSPILAPGKTYSHTFPNAGKFGYHDALHPTLKGTVTVKRAPAPAVVTLSASAPVVKYGTQVTLSGTVSTKKSGETVTLVQLPTGQTTKQVLATLQTTTNGAFSFNVTPQVTTLYQAQIKTSESSVTVQVAPLVKLPAASRSGYFHFYVTAATSFAGHHVFLQRFTLAHTWVNISNLILGSRSGRLVSVRYARSLIPRGRWSIRVFVPQDQVGAGYVAAASGSQPVVRRR
jgi:plastocyanin